MAPGRRSLQGWPCCTEGMHRSSHTQQQCALVLCFLPMPQEKCLHYMRTPSKLSLWDMWVWDMKDRRPLRHRH